MIKLLKYELLRKKKAYIIAFCIFAVLTVLTAIGIPRLDKDTWILLVSISAVVCIVGCVLLPFIINIINYYGDYKNRNGYMMFLTPSSGFKIFGSKILAVIIDVLAFFILLALYVFISYSVANASYDIAPQLNNIWSEVQTVFPSLNLSAVITITCIAVILQNISTIILAQFSITVSKTLLSHRSINWFVPLLIFIVLKWVEQFVAALIFAAVSFNDLRELIMSNNPTMDISFILILTLGINVAFGAVYTIASSFLISKKLDL